MRELVHGRCRKPVTRAQTADESRCKQQSAVVVNGWITEVGGDGVSAVGRVNAFEVLCYLIEGLVPTDALPAANSAAHGMSQPIFVEVNVLQRNSLGADVSAAERIVFIAANL